MPTATKRQNFNVTPEQEAEIDWLRDTLGVPTAKEAVLRAIRVLGLLAREAQQGRSIYLRTGSGELTRLLIPELEKPTEPKWKYLISRPHAWRRQFYVKGRKLSAFTVWMDMQVNEQTREETADNWDLSLEAVDEIIRYCEENKELLGMEADEEKRRLLAKGYSLEPPPPHR